MYRRQYLKKWIKAPILAIMLLFLLPGTALADSEFVGDGSEGSPYQIATASDLARLAELVNVGNTDYNANDKCYQLTADLDLSSYASVDSGRGWTPIGCDSSHFKGSFDGGGYTVTGLTINRSNAHYQGLFGYVNSGAEIKNVGVTDSNIKGGDYVGGIIGCNKGTVSNCIYSGSVSGEGDDVGGVVGMNNGGTVLSCVNTGGVSGASGYTGGVVGYNAAGTVSDCINTGGVTGGSIIGGVLGLNASGGTVLSCRNTGSVSGSVFVGGVVGQSSNGTVSRCYNTGSVSGSGFVGGVLGLNGEINSSSVSTVSKCYSTGSITSSGVFVGGVVGDNVSAVSGCYYDSTTSGVGGGIGGGNGSEDVPGKAEGKTTGEMQSGTAFTSWDINVWIFKAGRYPQLNPAAIDISGKTFDAAAAGYGEQTAQEFTITNISTETITGLTAQIGGTSFEISAALSSVSITPKGTATVSVRPVTGLRYGTHTDTLTITGDNDIILTVSLSFTVMWRGDTDIDWYNGTATEFTISTEERLAGLAELVNGGTDFIDKTIILDDNIVLNTEPGTTAWTPIGTSDHPFKGTFDGDGHTISGVYINSTDSYQGLFGIIDSGGIVKNVGVTDSYIKGKSYVGGVAGFNYGTVANCCNTGSVAGSSDYAGGVAGHNYGMVLSCYNTGSVSGSHDHVGGMAGKNNGIVANCYNTGSVSSHYYTGGVAGSNYGTVSNCYNTGSVSASGYRGGVAGYDEGTILGCYYDKGTSTVGGGIRGEDVPGKAEGKTTAAMQTDTPFDKWDIGFWVFVSGRYPQLSMSGGIMAVNPASNTFPEADAGHSEAQEFTLTNIGAETITGLSAALTEGTYFVISTELSDTSIASGSTATVSVQPVTGLSIGVYTDTLTITGDNDICLTVSLYFSVMNTSWYNENATEFIITTAEDLAGLAALVNDGNDFDGKTITLSNDIALNDVSDVNDWATAAPYYSWTAIGTSGNPFAGTFDGGGHTVSGVYISTSANYQGLFGYVGSSATVKNVGVTDSYIEGGSNFGGIAGHNHGTISNCCFTGSLSGSGDCVGGIAGYTSSTGKIENCSSIGSDIQAHDCVGGVAGKNYYGTVSNCRYTGGVTGSSYVGGVTGTNNGGTVSGCLNTGGVSGSGNDVGGVTGMNNEGTVSGCLNNGGVSGSGDCVGGIAGFVAAGKISNCCNTGGVTGSSYVGGMAGHNISVISNSYNTGNISGTGRYVGGVAGVNKAVVKNCAALNQSVSGASSIGRVAGGDSDSSLSCNYAFSGMTGGGSDKTLNGADGADMTLAQLYDPGFWTTAGNWDGSAWDGSTIWAFFTNKLPILKNMGGDQTGDPPAHLIPVTYTVTYDANNGEGTAPTESDKAEGATFTAAPANSFTAPTGKQFKQWNTESDGSGTSYAAGAEITMPAENLTLYAIWEASPASTGSLIVTVAGSGGSVTRNGKGIGSSHTEQLATNTNVRLEAVPEAGYTFAYWAIVNDYSERVISTDSVYEHVLGAGIHIKAVFSKTPTGGESKYTVTFKDKSGRILKSTDVARNGQAAPPANPAIVGYRFTGWNKSYDSVTRDLIITAAYAREETTHTVTAVNGTLSEGGTSGEYQFDMPVTVTADTAPAGQQFSHWTMDGVKVSTKSTFSFFSPMKNIRLTAVFTDGGASLNDVPFITLLDDVMTDETNGSMMFTAIKNVPEDFTLVECGALLASGELSGELTLATTGVRCLKINNFDNDMFYARKTDIGSGEMWNARGYLIYQDGNGNLVTVYSSATVNRTMGGE